MVITKVKERLLLNQGNLNTKDVKIKTFKGGS